MELHIPQDERRPLARDVWLLLLATALIFLPDMVLREVRGREALHATVAEEMLRSGSAWMTTVHGEPVHAYPGYAWLVALATQAGVRGELAPRLPAFLCMVGLATLCGVVSYRRGGAVAGVVAAAMVLCNPASLRVGTRAQSEPLLALLLCAAWMTWYSFGQRRKRWALGWAGAMAFVLAAAFTAGGRAIALFYLPFLFLRRPVRGRRRLLLPSHLAVLAVLVVVVAIWLRRYPDQIFLPWNEEKTLPQVTLSYPIELLLFPLKCVQYLMPWPLIAWPAFCMAYRPLEKSPVAFHYLRTIVVSAFLATWLVPKLSPLVLLPVLGPLAIMTGLHAEMLVRRHRQALVRLSTVLLGLGASLAGLGLLATGLHFAGVVRLEGLRPGLLLWDVAVFLTMLATAGLAWRGPWRRMPFHTHLVIGFMTLAAGFLAIQTTWDDWAHGEMRDAGRALAGVLSPPDYLVAAPPAVPEAAGTAAAPAVPATAPLGTAATVPVTYRPLSESIVYRQTRSSHLGVCYYLGRPIVRVQDPKTQIPLPVPGPWQVLGEPVPGTGPEATGGGGAGSGSPIYRDAIYALCDSGPPVVPEVEWVPLTPPIDPLRRKAVRHTWFPGGIMLLRLYTEAAPLADDYQPEAVRLYRGVRR